MSSYRKIVPTILLNETVTSPTAAYSQSLKINSLRACVFMVEVGAGLSGSVVVQVSEDESVWGNLSIPIAPLSGSAVNIPIDIETGFTFIRVGVLPSSGSGTVKVTGSAKGA